MSTANDAVERLPAGVAERALDWLARNFALDANARRLAESVRHRVEMGQGTALEQELVRKVFSTGVPALEGSGRLQNELSRRQAQQEQETR